MDNQQTNVQIHKQIAQIRTQIRQELRTIHADVKDFAIYARDAEQTRRLVFIAVFVIIGILSTIMLWSYDQIFLGFTVLAGCLGLAYLIRFSAADEQKMNDLIDILEKRLKLNSMLQSVSKDSDHGD